MSSGKQRRSGSKGNSRTSPSSSPPMPPAPTLAQNRGSASPRHAKDEVLLTAPVSSQPRSNKSKVQTPARASAQVSAQTLAQAPPAIVDGTHLVQAAVPTPGGKKGSFRRLIINMALIYLGYTVFFVCPKQPDSGSNAVCEGILKFQNWLRPYSEPYIDQYGRPLYKQGEKYYTEIAQPVFKTASDKAKLSYNQYAQPHVHKALDTLYTDNVKAHVNQAQTTFNNYQKHAQGQVDYAKKISNDHVWRIHETHIQPAIHKVSPHAKAAWDSAAVNANKVYDTASALYTKRINPYARQLSTVVFDAAKGAMETFAKHTDEIWGTSLSKESQSVDGRTTSRAARKAKEAQKKAQEAADAADKKIKQAKADADAQAENVKDTLLKKAGDAQKVAHEYSETVLAAGMAGAHEAKKAADEHVKIPKASDIKAAAEHFVETATEAVVKKAHEAQKVGSDEAEHLRVLAEEKAAEAGKISEQIKKAVVEKAHEAQEAAARQAEHIRHSAQDQAQWAQEAGASIVTTATRAAHSAKESVKREAERVAELASKKKEDLEKKAQQEAAAMKLAAVEKEKQAKKIADEASVKAQKAFTAAGQQAEGVKTKVLKTKEKAGKAAREQVEDVKKTAQEHVENAQNIAQEHAKNAQNVAQEQAEGIKKTAQEQAGWMMESADQIVMSGKENANKVKDYVAHRVEEAGDQAEHAKDTVRHKAHDAHTASKVALAAMLAGIETTFGKFYEYEDTETKNLWSRLQGAINEHIAKAKESAQDLEKANREAYELFESYIRDWRNQGGDLEDRLSKLNQRSVESIKKIASKAEEDQKAARSKAEVLSNNVEVYLSGLVDFLSDRLAASKETIASELSVFKDTSSEDDEKAARSKLAELELAAKGKLEETGSEARQKAQQLLKQVDEIWSQSEANSREYVKRTRELAKKASKEAKTSMKKASTPDLGGKDSDAIPEKEQQREEEAGPNVRVAMEEPGSGHRHHRHL